MPQQYWSFAVRLFIFPLIKPYYRWVFWGIVMDGGETKKATHPQICRAYRTMIKLGTVIRCLKKLQKINESRDMPRQLCWHQHLFTENQQILLCWEILIFLIFFKFFWVFKNCFNKHDYNFDNFSEKTALDLLKIKVMTSKFLPIMLAVKIYHVTHVIL